MLFCRIWTNHVHKRVFPHQSVGLSRLLPGGSFVLLWQANLSYNVIVSYEFTRTCLAMDCHSSSTEKRNRPATDPPPPSGTGTTAQPAPAGGGLRLVARCTSPAEEGSRDLNRRQQTRPRERIDLNLTGAARKRHTLSPRIVLPAAALTPSPTTQIAAGMDSINLDKSPMGTAPLLVSSTSTSVAEEREGGSRSRRVPCQVADMRVGGQQEQHQQLEHMDTSSRTHSGETVCSFTV